MDKSQQRIRGGKFFLWLISQDVPINFAMAFRIRGNFTPEQFQQAVEKVQRKHPSSTTRVIKESDGSAYVNVDPSLNIPVRIIERQHAKRWVEEVTSDLQRPFDKYNEPPLRFIWLRGDEVSEIILVCDHVFVDGYSAAYVVRDLLSYMGNPELIVEPNPISMDMSNLIPAFPGKRLALWRGKLKAILLKVMISLAPQKGPPWKEMVSGGPPPHFLLPWELSKDQTAALVKVSRAQGTTVHAALCTAFLRAFGEFYGDGWKRKIQSPVDLRKRLARPVDEFLNLYVHLVEFFVDCSPERDFWDVARDIKRGFERHSSDKPVFSSILETTALVDELASIITPGIISQTFKGVEYDLSITNLGRLDIPVQYGSLQLESLYGPAIGGNPEEIVLGVITIGDKMRFTMAFTPLKLSLAKAEQIKENAMQWLADAAGWGHMDL